MRMFLLGSYVTGFIATFLLVGFFCMLGGRDEDMWKPFVYAAAWPVMLLWYLSSFLVILGEVMSNPVEYHTVENWDKARSGMFTIIIDAWWCVDGDGNPLFYSKHNHPQCNQSKAIAERLANGRDIKQLPVVYVPLRMQDYI